MKSKDKEWKLKYYIFNNIKDFSKTVEKAKKLYKDNSCSCLIGFGSSLALDYAYKFSGFIKNKDYSSSDFKFSISIFNCWIRIIIVLLY